MEFVRKIQFQTIIWLIAMQCEKYKSSVSIINIPQAKDLPQMQARPRTTFQHANTHPAPKTPIRIGFNTTLSILQVGILLSQIGTTAENVFTEIAAHAADRNGTHSRHWNTTFSLIAS